MPVRRVLVTSAGSSPGLDMSRSLARDPSLEIVGADASETGRSWASRVCHATTELPLAAEDPRAYADALDAACEGVDFLFISLDVEVEALARAVRVTACPCPVPFDCVPVILDKLRTASALPEGLAPRTAVVNDPESLTEVLSDLGTPVWLRPATGTSGQGSVQIEHADEGRTWIEFWARRGLAGSWIAQEFLPGRNLNWTGLWRDGELLAVAAMERTRYFLAKVAVSGVTGQVSECVTVDPADAADEATRAVHAVSERPHGLYSVDLCEDASGRPRVTEINPRPAGRPWLYTEAGANLILAAARALTGGEPGDAIRPGGARVGVSLHRQLDVEPLIRG